MAGLARRREPGLTPLRVLIVSDYRLPRFGAPQALEISQRAGSSAPFVVVSGKVGEDVAVGMMRAGAHDYVMKDNLARLCATVARGLEEAEERRKLRQAERELSLARRHPGGRRVRGGALPRGRGGLGREH